MFDAIMQIREASGRCVYVCVHDESSGHDSSFCVSDQKKKPLREFRFILCALFFKLRFLLDTHFYAFANKRAKDLTRQY